MSNEMITRLRLANVTVELVLDLVLEMTEHDSKFSIRETSSLIRMIPYLTYITHIYWRHG